MMRFASVVTVSFALSATPGWATLMDHDPLDYAPVGSDALGKNGGLGFRSTPWVAAGYNASINNYDVAGGSLAFHGLATSGNHATTGAVGSIAGIARPLQVPVFPTDTTTRYVSMLLRPEGTVGAGAYRGFFGFYLEGSPVDVFVGKPGGGAVGNYVMENRGGGGQVASSVPVVAGEPVFMVLKAEYTPSVDRFTLYINPAPGGPEPTSGLVKTVNAGPLSALQIYSTGAFSFDEPRVGESYADVTPIPEPSAWSLAAVALACLWLLARRRRT